MLKSKRDEAIKRYLARVGKLEHTSKMYDSRYYKISYGEGLEILLRFSDHFNGELKTKPDIDLIKTSVGFYVIKANSSGISATLEEATIIPYLKSFLLVYPEVLNATSSLLKASQYAEKQLINEAGKVRKLEAKIKKKSEEFALADEIWDTNKKLVSDNKALKNTIETQKKQYSDLKTKCASIELKCNQIKDKLLKFQSIRKSLDELFKILG